MLVVSRLYPRLRYTSPRILITQALDEKVRYLLLLPTDPVDIPSTREEDEHDTDLLLWSHLELDDCWKRENEQIQVVDEVDHTRSNAENPDETSWVAALLSGHASQVYQAVGSTLRAANDPVDDSCREVVAETDSDTDIHQPSDVGEGVKCVEDEAIDGELDDPDQEWRCNLYGQ